jgi:hypothetical protein
VKVDRNSTYTYVIEIETTTQLTWEYKATEDIKFSLLDGKAHEIYFSCPESKKVVYKANTKRKEATDSVQVEVIESLTTSNVTGGIVQAKFHQLIILERNPSRVQIRVRYIEFQKELINLFASKYYR